MEEEYNLDERIPNAIKSLLAREASTWRMAGVYLANSDSHGIMDMGAELQALERTRKELEKLVREGERKCKL